MNLVRSILQAAPERVAGLDRSSWTEFRVSDSTGTHVVLEEDGDVISDFYVGRVAFSQPPQQQQGYGRNQNPIIKSHVRVADDEKVYLVDGYLSLMFNDKPSSGVILLPERTCCPSKGSSGWRPAISLSCVRSRHRRSRHTGCFWQRLTPACLEGDKWDGEQWLCLKSIHRQINDIS